ncbi:MAG: sialate O-acetylesterase, partial [Atribacterota bacterium]
YKNFKLFINSLRGKYGQIPFIYGRISKFYQFGQAVREAQNKIVDELPLTQIINTDDLPKQNDGLHFNTEGLNKLGKRFANAYYRLKK